MSEEKFNIEELNKAFADLKIKTGGLPLLRGLRISNNRERKLPHPENRPPLGSSGSFTLMYNSVIDAGFKIPNIRSHSIFATGNIEAAKIYGNIFTIAPAGDFKFLWSPRISDSWTNENMLWNAIAKKLIDDTLDINTTKLWYILSRDIFEDLKEHTDSSWVHTTTHDKLLSLYYNMFNLEKFLPKSINAGKFPSFFKKALQQVALEFFADNIHLKSAIESHNEILIYESDGYFIKPYENI